MTSFECAHEFGTEPSGTEELQLNSDSSVPAHVRPLIQMGPVPSPKAAAGKVLVTGNKSDAIFIQHANNRVKDLHFDILVLWESAQSQIRKY